jgi:ppGpp synthetase/RelA/SpoT-type nucleotidyltranferase
MAGRVSNTQADKAAGELRRFLLLPVAEKRKRGETDRLYHAITTIIDYRAMHAYPLKKVTMGVRAMTETELGPDAPRPGQRFKRFDRIMQKLVRYDTMRLSQMEDIGGCRVVVPTLDECYAVAGRLRRRWRVPIIDHVERPKDDGYRALHVVENRDGRQIEVQVRTERQHR